MSPGSLNLGFCWPEPPPGWRCWPGGRPPQPASGQHLTARRSARAGFEGWRRIGSAGVATGAAVVVRHLRSGVVVPSCRRGCRCGQLRDARALGERPRGEAPAALTAELPQACDLIVSCLSAGLTGAVGVRVVAASTTGAMAEELAEAMAKITLGVDEARVWSELAVHPRWPRSGGVGGGRRPGYRWPSGSRTWVPKPVRSRRSREVGARKVGVSSVLPLMMCFLPSFVLLGLVPVVGGVVSKLFG